MASCPFCAIVAGEGEAHRLYEGEATTAFFDADPATPGHALVVPNRHTAHLFTEDPTLATAVFETVRDVSRALDEIFDPDGVSLFYTSADLVGNVTHAHVHLVPRYDDDDIHLALPRNHVPEEDAARLAAAIQDRL